MHCLLIGNFGVGNLGDEALREYFLTRFPEVTWTVVSASPKGSNEVARLPFGIRSLLSLRWIRTIGAYRSADAVIFGGGSLFTDIESVAACFLWRMHAFMARLCGKPLHLAYQGIGPFRTGVGERLARKTAAQAATISVRDRASLDRIKRWQLNKNIVLTCDPVLWLVKNEKIDSRTENILVLIPRKNSSEKFTTAAQNAASSRSWDEIRVLCLEPRSSRENLYSAYLTVLLGPRAVRRDIHALPELLSALAPAGRVVTERYHGAIAALACGKETVIVCQRKGDKLQALESERNLDADAVRSGEELLRSAIC